MQFIAYKLADSTIVSAADYITAYRERDLFWGLDPVTGLYTLLPREDSVS